MVVQLNHDKDARKSTLIRREEDINSCVTLIDNRMMLRKSKLYYFKSLTVSSEELQ